MCLDSVEFPNARVSEWSEELHPLWDSNLDLLGLQPVSDGSSLHVALESLLSLVQPVRNRGRRLLPQPKSAPQNFAHHSDNASGLPAHLLELANGAARPKPPMHLGARPSSVAKQLLVDYRWARLEVSLHGIQLLQPDFQV